jgi:transcription antitermination protein NusB
MGRRRQARELALQALYFLEEQRGDPEQALALFCTNFMPPRKSRAFFLELVRGVQQTRVEIDRLVESYSDHWKVFRMPRVDRNVIRVAVYEMLWLEDIPAKVSINEAIDIGKRFGTDDSGAFINGILDRIRLALEKGEIERPPGKHAAEASPETQGHHPSTKTASGDSRDH